MYFDFEEKFRAIFEFYFRNTIYCFEAQEVISPTLSTMYKLELK